MAAKSTFTFQQLLTLMTNSPAVRSMNPFVIYVLMQAVIDVTSSKAQRVYKILMAEKDRYGKIEEDFVKSIRKILEGYKAGITDVKMKFSKRQRKQAEAATEAAEEKAAEDILKSIL